jgi:hypothetical protein
MRLVTRRSLLGCIVTALVISFAFTGCRYTDTGKSQPTTSPSPFIPPTVQPTQTPIIQPTPTPFIPGPFFDPGLSLSDGPIDVPLELQIPLLNVDAPMVGVGLTSKNVMDAPKGPIGDPIWSTAFWYRGSSTPGDIGTATIAGHVNDPLGRLEIFANLEDLHPGDLIIIHDINANMDIQFVVNQVVSYSVQQSKDPAVLTQIFGDGPVYGEGPQPSVDGLSHLTLITCAGNIVHGEFDHHTVVYATRSP